jgi:hypothetical protein
MNDNDLIVDVQEFEDESPLARSVAITAVCPRAAFAETLSTDV